MHEPGVGALSFGQPARHLNRLNTEIDAGHAGAEPRPAQRVDVEVVLDVQERLARYIANLVLDIRRDLVLASLEPRHIVKIRSLVRARYLVPPALICRKRLAGGDITRQFPAVGHASTRISV